MNPADIFRKFYEPGTPLSELLLEHSKRVTEKALQVARRAAHLTPDLLFIEEAGLLHDIGIFLTRAPSIHCHGSKPYICHGYLGRELLDKEGLPRHALVCERHTGVGITREEISEHQLPLPFRNMVPVSLEEKIVCYADKFFSKNPRLEHRELSVEEVAHGISKHGPEKAEIFKEWQKIFGG